MLPLAQEQRDKPGASYLSTGHSGKQRSDVKRAGASARTSEHDRASSYKPYTMVPALGVVGGTPGWAVRRIISRRSPPASHASHDCAVLAPLRDRLRSLITKYIRQLTRAVLKKSNCRDTLHEVLSSFRICSSMK